MLPSRRNAIRPTRALGEIVRPLAYGTALICLSAMPARAGIDTLPGAGPAPQGPALISLATSLPAPEAEGITHYAIDGLPEDAQVAELVTATLLQSRAVSTISGGGASEAPLAGASGPAELSLETAFALAPANEGPTLRVGSTDLTAVDYAKRIGTLAEGFSAARRGFALAVVADPEGLFPARIDALRDMLSETGFPMWVLLLTGEETGADCAPALSRHVTLSLLGGVADRPAFGNADGATDFAEAEAFVTRILTDGFARSETCGGAYAVVLHNQSADGPVLVHDSPVYIPAQQEELTVEEFEAEFLSAAEDPSPIRAYLQSCRFCPAAERLEARLTEIDRRAALARIEDKVWDRIAGASPDADRLAVYLERCVLCAHRDEAEAALARLQAARRAVEEEDNRFAALAEGRDLEGLRDYVETCEACTHRETALARIEEIEADEVYAREMARLEQAIAAGDTEEISAWIESCEYCDDRPRAEAALERLARRDALAAPCLAEAAVPQLGGPRLLSEIDQGAARSACAPLLAAFPGDAQGRVLEGRIAQAAGEFAQARDGYDAGTEAGVPMAFGLAGYMAFDPAEGQPDYARAEKLALQGTEAGDWMSRQLLVLLYSQGLRPGKGPDDALGLVEITAREGDPVSQYFLGFFHLNGDGPSGRPDPETARLWLSRAVEADYVPAMTLLAETLETAVATEPEAAEAAAGLYLRALRAGDTLARDKLTAQLRERNRAVVRSVQAQLRQEGIYRGALDGLPGPGTIAAVETYGAAESAG